MKYELKEMFKWKPNGAEEIAVSEMETRHLWFTLKMIWNHTMPEQHKFHPYKKYAFGPRYTTEYMLEAVSEILKVLKDRKDIQKNWLKEMLTMDLISKSYIKKQESLN